MSKYVKIKDLKKTKDVQQCVFAIFYAEDGTPYKNYRKISRQKRDKIVPLFLVLSRWDGCFGLPGGKVDPGETLLQALVREVREEINYHIESKVACGNYEVVGSWESGNKQTHVFGFPVTYEELKLIRTCSTMSQHIDCENGGTVLIPAVTYSNNRGFRTFLGNKLKSNCRGVLIDFVKKKKWKV